MHKGTISVQTENIFPIIKQFLYSDQEIFLRELVSNAVDATTKLQTLAARGEVQGEIGDTHIDILLDEEGKTITIRDRGIGMTEAEVEKYLNQVAFSSAAEFLEKYKADGANIIGHFGLGFYSAFMVATKVEARTVSYQPNSKGVTWSCDGTPEYEITENDKTERGTDIVLHIEGDDAAEYLSKFRIKELLAKYCKFLPVEIRFEGEKVNNPTPAWRKPPVELTDEDYRAFYHELYPTGEEPLFWIHLNIDYPFNLTGVLFFPELRNRLEIQKNKIHLYSNQVYVTDEVKDIVPEFLQLLQGVIDSPDIPLNVSRSALQADRNVKKITSYITRKVADKLEEMYKADREGYTQKWSDIGVFVKYGMLSDDKFEERARKFVLLENTEHEFFTLEEYTEKIKVNQTDKNGNVVALYTNSPIEHVSYIKAARERGYDVLETDNVIDSHFIQHLETKLDKTRFVRVDADTLDRLIETDTTLESVMNDEEQERVKKIFTAEMPTMGAELDLRALAPTDAPVQITRPEFMRRMQEMEALRSNRMGSNDALFDFYQVVVNTNHPLVAEKLLALEGERQSSLARHLLDLARLQQNSLKGEDLASFIQRSLTMAAI